MAQKHSPSKKDQLSILMASGHTAASAARELGIVERTAQLWAKKSDFRALVAQHRESAIDAAVGQLTSQAKNAAVVIATLMLKSKNETIRLSAARTVLEKLMHVEDHVRASKLLDELIARIETLEGHHASPKRT